MRKLRIFEVQLIKYIVACPKTGEKQEATKCEVCEYKELINQNEEGSWLGYPFRGHVLCRYEEQ